MRTGSYTGSREDLMHRFPDPFETADPRRSYFRWFELHGPAERLRPLVKLLKKSAPPRALRLAKIGPLGMAALVEAGLKDEGHDENDCLHDRHSP